MLAQLLLIGFCFLRPRICGQRLEVPPLVRPRQRPVPRLRCRCALLFDQDIEILIVAFFSVLPFLSFLLHLYVDRFVHLASFRRLNLHLNEFEFVRSLIPCFLQRHTPLKADVDF